MLKNWLLIKDPRFLSNAYETWRKRLSREAIIFTKFNDDWTKILDFLLLANFWMFAVFFTQTLDFFWDAIRISKRRQNSSNRSWTRRYTKIWCLQVCFRCFENKNLLCISSGHFSDSFSWVDHWFNCWLQWTRRFVCLFNWTSFIKKKSIWGDNVPKKTLKKPPDCFLI